MRKYVPLLLAALGVAPPALAQITTECTNLAKPPTDGIWKVSSQLGLPQQFEFMGFIQYGVGFQSLSGVSANDVWAVGGETFLLNGFGETASPITSTEHSGAG